MPVLHRLTIIAALALGSCYFPAVGIAQSPSTPTTQPDDEKQLPLLYEFYFHHMETIDQIYAKALNEGRDVSGWKDKGQVVSGMSDTEWSIFHDIAIECRRISRTHDEKIAKVLAQVAQARRSGVGDTHPTELDDLIAERKSLVANSILQFRQQAGETAFQRMNNFLLHNIQASTPAEASKTPVTSVSTGANTASTANAQVVSK
jgi:hypothetical protein